MSSNINTLRKAMKIMLSFQIFVQVYCICNLVITLRFPADGRPPLEENTHTSHIILATLKTIGLLVIVTSIIIMRKEQHSIISLHLTNIFFTLDLLFQMYRLFFWNIDVDKELHDVYHFPEGVENFLTKKDTSLLENIGPRRRASDLANIISVFILVFQVFCAVLTGHYFGLMRQHQTDHVGESQ